MGAGWSFALMPYGAKWRRYRKAFHEHFQPNIVPNYQPIQLEATKSFLRRLLATPDDFMDHIRQYVPCVYRVTIYLTTNGGTAFLPAQSWRSYMESQF